MPHGGNDEVIKSFIAVYILERIRIMRYKDEPLKKLLNDNLGDSVKEIFEIGIDSLFDNELVENVPIVNTICGLFNLGKSIGERFFIKKLVRFLECSDSIDQDEIIKFFDKYKDEDIQERLIMIIDKIDEIEKARVISNLFRAVVGREISKNDFMRCCIAVQSCMLIDLEYLKQTSGQNIKGVEAQSLFNVSLVRVNGIDAGTFLPDPEHEMQSYIINRAGRLIIKYL